MSCACPHTREQGSVSGDFLSGSLPSFLRQGPLPNPELSVLAKLPGQQAPRIPDSAPRMLRLQTQTVMPDFGEAVGDSNPDLHGVYQAVFL